VSAPGRFTIGQRWAVMNEDGSAMPLDRTFNVWASCAGSLWYVDSDHDGWGDAGTALGSCAPIAGYATLSGDRASAGRSRPGHRATRSHAAARARSLPATTCSTRRAPVSPRR
jgi:hypothetical protein